MSAKHQTQPCIRDASQDRQPEIHSTQVREDSQELNPWSSGISEPIHSSTAENENQTPVQDQRCHSGPSAKNSVIPSEGDSLKNDGADQQRLQISDLHFDKFPDPATFVCWKIRFKTEVCTCSQLPYGSYAVDQRSGDC